MKWKQPTMTTEQRGFTGTYDAAGHRVDVIALLQDGKTGAELSALHQERIAVAQLVLSDDDVLEMRVLRSTRQLTYAQLGELFGCSSMTAWNTINGVNGLSDKTAVS